MSLGLDEAGCDAAAVDFILRILRDMTGCQQTCEKGSGEINAGVEKEDLCI